MSHQLINVRLSRNDSSPWGFRLQGGKDFAQPLLIQKVNGGSLSERAGLQVGDALIRVNNIDVYNLRHKEAQEAIVKAGSSFELTIERGPSSTWKPQVTSVGSVPSPGGGASPITVTKTSLAAKQLPTSNVGSAHNLSPRPFGSPQQQGQDTVKAIVNKQYNTPVNMYSEESIAETLSAQAEVLAGGVLGVNFKKNEKTYDAQRSEVLKMIHEVDSSPKEPENVGPSCMPLGIHPTSPRPMTPVPKQAAEKLSEPLLPNLPQLPREQSSPNCSCCNKLIVGVFVRIKDKNLHVDCFKCATCGTPLKNVGYYNINNKLYCDIHAKLAAKQNAPAPNLEPVTIPPGIKPPSSVLPPGSPSSIAPLPFHSPRIGTSHVSFPKYRPQDTSSSAPKPFSAPAAPVAPPIFPTSVPKAPSVAPFQSPAPPPTLPIQPPMQAPSTVPQPTGGGRGSVAGASAPKRGRGVLNPNVGPTARIPQCGQCSKQIRGPFITALGKIWCPEHFICSNAQCRRPLQDIGFVEESDGLYCEFCFEKFLAPMCAKCNSKVKGDCLNAIGKQFHPECFCCAYCGKMFGNSPFFLEDSLPYCEADWNELFTTKCYSCGFPIEAGDRWVEALNNNYHSQCFTCTMCKKSLEGQSFYAKGGRPFCKTHAR